MAITLAVGAHRDRILVASGKNYRWPSRLEELGIEHPLQLARLGWLICAALRFEKVAVDDQFQLVGCGGRMSRTRRK